MDVKLLDDGGKDITDHRRGWRAMFERSHRGSRLRGQRGSQQELEDDGYSHTGAVGEGDEKTKKWSIVDRKKLRSRKYRKRDAEVRRN